MIFDVLYVGSKTESDSDMCKREKEIFILLLRLRSEITGLNALVLCFPNKVLPVHIKVPCISIPLLVGDILGFKLRTG